jgi:alpha-beta hydrolase superfamily lysophospholipase
LVWSLDNEPKAVVLVVHGGSGHKKSPAVLAIVEELLPLGVTVLAIDGPVHGERRADGNLDPQVAKQCFRDAWRSGIGRIDMAKDLSAALDRLLEDRRYRNLPIGYMGVSMGTAYGIPFLAEDPRVAAAVIGLWSSTYPASGHLLRYADRIRCPVWFTQQWDDEFFDRAGTADLFDKIGSVDKQLVAYPGPHMELQGRRLKDAVQFLANRLLKTDIEHKPATPIFE